MTRGEFAQIRQRMHGMDGDLRRVARSTSGASTEAARMSQNIQGLSDRMKNLHTTGNAAGSEMTHMRRTMGLLGRELRIVGREGGLTEDEFRSLSHQLERTRLDFDHLTRDIDRHSAVANRAARDESQRQAASQRMGQLQARAQREAGQRIMRMGQLQARALREDAERSQRLGVIQARAQREDAQRNAARQQQLQQLGALQARAQREDAQRAAAAQRVITAQQTASANQQYRNARRLAQAHTAALQEEARRRAQIQRDESARLRQGVGGGTTGGTTIGAGGADPSAVRRMVGGLRGLQRTLQGVSGSSADARRNIRLFNGDMNAMGRILRDAQASGTISRQGFNDLANGLRLADRNMRTLRSSGDLTRGTFRTMRRDVSALQAQLRLLGRDSGRFDLINARLLIFRRNLRTTGDSGGLMRRMFSRMGDWGLGGILRASSGLMGLAHGVRVLGARFAGTTRFMKMFMLVMLLMAPAAQALGALLVAVLGAAFIALGAFALRGNAEVKSAFQDMRSTVSSTVKEAALPMKDDLVSAIRNVGFAARGMQPMLTRAFTAAGPLINNMFGAVTDFAGSALPGLTVALEHSEMAVAGFRKGMSLMGDGFGDMFAIITKGNEEELARAWVVLGNEIRNVLESLGEFMSTALNSGTASMLMIGVFRTFTGVLNVMAAALDTVDAIFGSLFKHMADGISGFKSGENAMAEYFGDTSKSVKDLKKDLADYDKQIADIKSGEGEFKNAPEGVKEAYLKNLQSERAAVLAELTKRENEATAATLNHAKSVAELIQQIQNFADLNRSFLDAESAQEAAIDAAVEGYGKYSGALKKTNGQWDLSNKAAQEAYGLLSKVAQTTKEATDKAIASHAPWEQVRSNWKQGYDEIVRLGAGMKLSATDARALANEIMGMPPTMEVFFKARTEEAKANLDSVIAAFQAAPGEKIITVKALGQDAMAILQTLGYQVVQLPDGQFQITAQTADAKTNIGQIQAARDALKGKSIAISIPTDPAVLATYTIQAAINAMTGRTLGVGVYTTEYYKRVEQGGNAIGATTSIPGITKNANGGILSFFADGGMRQSEKHVAQIASAGSWRVWGEPETGGEAYIPLSETKRPRSRAVAAETVSKLGGSVQWFANGGKVSASERQARTGAAGELGISPFGRVAGYTQSSFLKQLSDASSVNDLVNSLNKWRGIIKAATSGLTEKKLLTQLARSGAQLLKYERQQAKVNAALEKAKEKLSGLRDAAGQLRDQVASGITGAANITQTAQGDKTVTTRGILGDLRRDRDRAVALEKALATLRARGLNAGSLSEIAQAGIEGGGLETASALLTASKGDIKEINALEKQLAKSAVESGKITAGAMYNAGIKAAEGLVKGLQKQQKNLDRLMENLAKSLEKAIKKAFGIKSAGGIVGAASGGARSGLTWTGEHGPELVKLPAGSQVRSNPDSRRMVADSRMGGQPIIVYQTITLDGKVIAQQIFDPLRSEISHRGGNVQKVLGR